MIFYTKGGLSQASSADIGTKIKIILANKEKYSISAMCRYLKISRSSLYYKATGRADDVDLRNDIQIIFKDSRNNYGARKIKVELSKKGYIASRRKIRQIMNELGLVSNYTVKQYKVHKSTCNNDLVNNEVKREFERDVPLEVVVSDLTYVNVGGKWNYICLLLDLYNREIIGYSVGKNKDAQLVYKAFHTVKRDLSNISIFHIDRRNEFKTHIIDEVLKAFEIKRSLSAKGFPYDNAVAEATYKVVKTEFAFNRRFEGFKELERELFDYANWYNNIRIHGSLGYLAPVAYRQAVL